MSLLVNKLDVVKCHFVKRHIIFRHLVRHQDELGHRFAKVIPVLSITECKTTKLIVLKPQFLLCVAPLLAN